MFQEQFAAFYNENELPDGYSIATLDSLCSIKGGKRLPADGELLDTPTAHPYIRVRDLGSNRYVCLTNQFQYIDKKHILLYHGILSILTILLFLSLELLA